MGATKVYADFTPLARTKAGAKGVKDPAGFNSNAANGRVNAGGAGGSKQQGQKRDDSELRTSKAWEVALSPGKSLPMQAFMAWMSGTSVSIFSILITGMILMTPLRSILGTAQTFAPLERHGSGQRVDLSMQKMAFVAINLAGIIFGIYRLSIMGLLPTTSSDWLAFLPAKQYVEQSV
ncbi:ER membrane protein complex subunit 4 [Coemansia sp. RSA 552]|nr:ER membrane protein complex subunit 4 [Coemansia sp. RSA 552]